MICLILEIFFTCCYLYFNHSVNLYASMFCMIFIFTGPINMIPKNSLMEAKMMAIFNWEAFDPTDVPYKSPVSIISSLICGSCCDISKFFCFLLLHCWDHLLLSRMPEQGKISPLLEKLHRGTSCSSKEILKSLFFLFFLQIKRLTEKSATSFISFFGNQNQGFLCEQKKEDWTWKDFIFCWGSEEIYFKFLIGTTVKMDL